MNGQYEDKTASAFLAPGAETELVHIHIPAGQRLVISGFGNDVNNALAWGDAQWDVIADGTPVRSYTNIRDQYGTANEMRRVPPGFIVAYRDLVVIAKNNHAANTYSLLVTLQGEYLPNV